MIQRVSGFLRHASRSRNGKDTASLAKRQRALSYDTGADLQKGDESTTRSDLKEQRPPSPSEDTSTEFVSPTVVSDPAQLERRQQEEKEFIRRHDTAEADVWYLVDVHWLQEWKHFVTKDGTMPGPIDNSRLVDRHTGQSRRGLHPVNDYRGVNGEIWSYWHQRYGGGPVVKRKQLDLYAESLEVPTRAEREPPRQASRRRPAASTPQAAEYSAPARVDEERSDGSSGARSAGSSSTPQRGRAPAQPPAASSNARRGPRGASVPVTRTSPRKDESEANLCCDRCDGPHASERCPHFRKPRDKHQDAWTSYGKLRGSKDLGDGAPIVRNARVVRQPGDGSCLFHSLSFGLSDESSAKTLRRDICGFIAKHPDETIAGTALKDWIYYDSGGTVESYAQRMSQGTWGGGIEMAALTKMRNVNVHVYEKFDGGYRRISAFESPGAQKTVSVLYQGRMHYDAIVV